MITLLPLSLLTLTAPLYLYILRKPLLGLLTPRAVPNIPYYTDSLPLLGDWTRANRVIDETGLIGAVCDRACMDLGPICQIRVSFFQRLIIISDGPSIEHILLKSHKSVDRAYQWTRVFRTILGKAMITLSTGSQWKHHRKIVGPGMGHQYLRMSAWRVEDAVKDLVGLWRGKMGVGKGKKGWKALADLEGATMDAICGMAFGESWGINKHALERLKETFDPLVEGPHGEAVFKVTRPALAESVLYKISTIDQYALSPSFSHFWTRQSKAWKTHHKRLEDYFDSMIFETRKKISERGVEEVMENAENGMDMMISRGEVMGRGLSEGEMKEELLQYLVGGTETSSTVLSWYLKYITKHPEIQHKLRQHILDRLPEISTRGVRFEDLNDENTPYLEAVIYETLRLSQLIVGVMRDVTEDIVVLGRVVPKGETLLLLTSTGLQDTTSTGLSESYGPTAQDVDEKLQGLRTGEGRKTGYWEAGTGMVFDPDRWMTKEGLFDPLAGPGGYPFGLGPRACFGKNLAMLQLRVFIAHLTHSFFFAPTTEEQSSWEARETMTRHPVRCFVRPVLWDSAEAQKSAFRG